MNCFKRILGEDWEVTPAGGATGDAYFAEKQQQRLFLKRNSSPFLAVLSAEGIVPKLVWTKRMENGDVITAQQWLEGRSLHKEEMYDRRIIQLLNKIHSSKELLNMLKRLGKDPLTPKDLYHSLLNQTSLQIIIQKERYVAEIVHILKEDLTSIVPNEYAVCHGDLHHNNLIKTDNGKIYLIDWDNTMITDPAYDLAFILDTYIQEENWHEWIEQYGLFQKEDLLKRVNFYTLLINLSYIAWYDERYEYERKFDRLNHLQEVYDRYKAYK